MFIFSYLHRKSSEELENGSSSTEGEEEETYENASLEDPNWEPFRLVLNSFRGFFEKRGLWFIPKG